MQRGATAEPVFIFPEDFDVSAFENIEVLVKGERSRDLITKSGDDIELLDDRRIRASFAQEDTLTFLPEGEGLTVQLRWRYHGGTVRISKPIYTTAGKFIGEGVL